MSYPCWKPVVLGCLFCVFGVTGCGSGSDADPGASTPASPTPPSPPPAPSPVVAINGLSAQPAVVLPGQSVILTASADDGAGGTLSYSWHVAQGTFSSSNTNPSTWTAPATEGRYQVSVDVTNGDVAARAYVTVLVATVPTQPMVTTVLPGEAKADDEVRILGTGFGSSQGSSVLTIGGATAATIVSWSDTEIRARVPATAITGAVVVRVGGVDSASGHIAILWDNVDPANIVASAATGNQSSPRAASDNRGGAIVAWVDYRNGGADIYAQRLDTRGRPLWTADGVVISATTNSQLAPQIVPDGSGGAIVVWQDYRNGSHYDIYAQRLNQNGVAQWTADGVAVCSATDNQLSPRIVGDGAGGAILVWEDRRNATDYDLFAQRVNGSGAVQWTTDGIAVINASNNQFSPQVIADGSGGAIVAWEDFRGGSHYDLYAQRMNDAGTTQWPASGVVVTDAANNQLSPKLAPDGAGGAVIVWQDYLNGSDFDIFAQRLDTNGATQWLANGVVLISAADNQVSPSIVPSGQDSFIVVWEDYRNGNADVYGQSINGAGAVRWNASGVIVSTAVAGQVSPQVVADDAGGAIIVWEDRRGGTTSDVYAQRLGSGGQTFWPTDGTVVSGATGNQILPQVVGDNTGGAIFAWEDRRDGAADVYAQGVSAGGKQ